MAVKKGDLRRPQWLDDWQDYPHGPLSQEQARELSGYCVRLEDRVRELAALLIQARGNGASSKASEASPQQAEPTVPNKKKDTKP